MITLQDALSIHSILIERFGGSHGIRDQSALESALARPFQSFQESDLYPMAADKAAALIESLVGNHPFIDGNKRVGYVLMRLLLNQYDLDIRATQDDKHHFVIQIASGEWSFDQIQKWIVDHTV